MTQGRAGTLECEVAGYPTPQVHWYRLGRELLDSRKYKVRSTGNIHTLTISDVYDEDTGDITVKVMNKGGSQTEKASVKLQGGLFQSTKIFKAWNSFKKTKK